MLEDMCKILIVEDERIVAMDLGEKVRQCGYEVFATVHSGEKALEVVDSQQPDFIIMDIMLEGDLDGIETTKIIKKKFSNIPVAFSTAYADEDTRLRAHETEPAGFLVKPVNRAMLREAIERALDKKATGPLPDSDKPQ